MAGYGDLLPVTFPQYGEGESAVQGNTQTENVTALRRFLYLHRELRKRDAAPVVDVAGDPLNGWMGRAWTASAIATVVDYGTFTILVELASVYESDGSNPIVVPLTQEDLSTMAGTTRPTANRILQVAAEGGSITVARGRVEIHDIERLRRLSR